MEDWLMSKKLEEAERVAHLKDVGSKDDLLVNDHLSSFKGFLRS
jgi:hypothetical protein